jgi:ubiquinol-cytochrome c reductase cytochrome b subunit
MVLLGLVGAHIVALHEVGSNNPDGVEIKKNKDADGIPKDGIPFHPYYTVKDLMGLGVFLILFSMVVFFAPEFFGWFLERDNFIPADPLKTPEHIVPLWYFTPFYAILRAIPDKLTGVVAMGASIFFLFILPWLDRHPIKSSRYRSSLFRLLLWVFAAVFLVLGYLGTQPATALASEIGLRAAELYFMFFLILWLYSDDRSAAVHFQTFVVMLAALLVIDAIRFDDGKGGLMMGSALLPLGYIVVFVLGPVFTRMNESRAVPERVTM